MNNFDKINGVIKSAGARANKLVADANGRRDEIMETVEARFGPNGIKVISESIQLLRNLSTIVGACDQLLPREIGAQTAKHMIDAHMRITATMCNLAFDRKAEPALADGFSEIVGAVLAHEYKTVYDLLQVARDASDDATKLMKG